MVREKKKQKIAIKPQNIVRVSGFAREPFTSGSLSMARLCFCIADAFSPFFCTAALSSLKLGHVPSQACV